MKLNKPTPTQGRVVVCIYCRRPQEVGTLAMSIPCRFCHRSLALEDVRIAGYAARRVIETCGSVIIEPKGDVTVNSITCAALELAGRLKGNVVCLGAVVVTGSGSLRGDITAPLLTVIEGGRLRGRCEITGRKAHAPTKL
jgi:cytoskeletal protein CcmA (bactofilin family)